MAADNRSGAAKEEAEKRQMKERVLRLVATSEARQRLASVRMVKPEIAQLIEDQILQLASAGKLNKPITDDDVKRFLSQLQQPKREFKIRWA